VESSSVPTPAPVPTQDEDGLERRLPGWIEEAADITIITWRTLKQLPKSFRFLSEILRQLAIMIRSSTIYLFLISFSLGILFVTFAYVFLKAAAAYDYLGAFTSQIDPRYFVPEAFGWAYASKVCCGMCSEIGAMRISEELDAYETEGVSAIQYVLGTRVAAALLYTPLAAVVCLLAMAFGGAFDALVILHALDPATFFSNNWVLQNGADSIRAFICIAVMGMMMTAVACTYGYRASGGPEGVGKAVARSLQINLVLSFFVTAVWESICYGVNPHLPIGG
jgi:phospholipid/cholesterol/gamma-HCH transport system permease protein